MLLGQKSFGRGGLFVRGRHLATVQYRIEERRTRGDDDWLPLVAQAPAADGWAADGSIVVIEGDRYLPVGETCTLKLETGTECKVYLSPQRIGSGCYRISIAEAADLP